MPKSLTPFRLVIFFVALSVGILLVAPPRLNIQYLPVDKGIMLAVDFNLPGTTPQAAEQQVTQVLENGLSVLEGVDKLYSQSRYEGGTITLKFKKGIDMQQRLWEANAIVRRLYPRLPVGTSYPSLQVAGGTEAKNKGPLLVYSIYAPLQSGAIADVALQQLVPRLRQVNGVKDVRLSGYPGMQWRIAYQSVAAEAFDISQQDIESAINQYTSGWEAGTVREKDNAIFVRKSSGALDITALRNIIVSGSRGQSVPLSAIADIRVEETEVNSWFRINGKNALTLSIYPQEEANQLALSELLKGRVGDWAKGLPDNYALSLDYDDAAFLAEELHKNNRRIGLCMAILLLFMLAAYRHWKHLLVLTASLAVTLCLTVLLVWLLGIPIHLYSMAGIAIAFGLLIDNAIVMVDHLRLQGNLKVFLALLAATLTTMAALLLVFLLPEADRQNLSDFAAIIAVALLASLVSSLGFTPALYTMLWGKNAVIAQTADGKIPNMYGLGKWYLAVVVFLHKYRRVYLALVTISFGLPLFLLPDTLEGGGAWARLYNNTLGNSWYRQNVRPITDKYLGGALYQFRYNVFEKSGYRNPEKTKLYVQAALPFGHTPQQMNALMTEVDKFLKGVAGIEKFVTEVNSGQEASVAIQFTPAAEREGLPYSLKSRLIARAVDWGGADWEVYGVGKGFSNGGNGLDIPNFRLRIKGYNYDQAERYAALLAEKLLRHPRIQKVNTNDQMDFWEKPKQQYFLELNQEQLANAFTQPEAVYNAVSNLTEPAFAQAKLAYQNDYLPIQIMAQDATDFSVHQLMHTGLKVDSVRRIKLDKAGSLELKTEANEVVRENRSYVRMVSFNYMGSANFGSKYLDKVLAEMKPLLLPGYTIEEASYGWNWGQAKRQYGLLFLLALAVFAICAVLFGRLRQSLYIVCMIPLSFIGLFLTFAWGDFYFDQGGYAAFVLLSGLVVNAAIFIINDYNLLVKQYPAIHANMLLMQALKNRALTIGLTTLSTCVGLAPFIWEGQQEVFWFSFAVGAIGGLLFSLLAVAFVLPVLLWRKAGSR